MPANHIAKLTRKPRRCATRNIISTISTSPISRKSGAAEALSLPGCSISPPFHSWTSRPSSGSPGAFRIRAKGAGRFSRPSNRPPPRRCSPLRCSSGLPRAAKMISRRRCSPRCVSSLADTSRRSPGISLYASPSGLERQEVPAMIPHQPDSSSTAAPCVMVIFGASGDLTKRKLIPALCNLAQDNLLPKQFAIVGFATNDFTTETFRKMLGEEVPKYAPTPIDLKTWDWLAQQTYYVRGDFQDAEAYKRLREQVEQADKAHNTQGNRFFYLAVAPRFFSPIAKMLGDCGLTKEESGHWARVIVEKPFGHDLESA